MISTPHRPEAAYPKSRVRLGIAVQYGWWRRGAVLLVIWIRFASYLPTKPPSAVLTKRFTSKSTKMHANKTLRGLFVKNGRWCSEVQRLGKADLPCGQDHEWLSSEYPQVSANKYFISLS